MYLTGYSDYLTGFHEPLLPLYRCHTPLRKCLAWSLFVFSFSGLILFLLFSYCNWALPPLGLCALALLKEMTHSGYPMGTEQEIFFFCLVRCNLHLFPNICKLKNRLGQSGLTRFVESSVMCNTVWVCMGTVKYHCNSAAKRM